MAGTAYGDIATNSESLQDAPPPNGTIFDRLQANSITWRNYFTDLPQTAIIPSIIEKYPTNLATIAQFYTDCATGLLPSVSFVDPEFGVLSDIGEPLASLPVLEPIGKTLETTGGDQENPQDMSYGESWAYSVLDAVLSSPAWPRTLLIYTYDEHGGYYDHVKPPAAIAPDSIAPALGPEDIPGGYDIYGPRVPAVVVSPYSKPNSVTNSATRSHLGARDDRGEVEPAGAHLPRRERQDGRRLPRSEEPACAARAAEPGQTAGARTGHELSCRGVGAPSRKLALG